MRITLSNLKEFGKKMTSFREGGVSQKIILAYVEGGMGLKSPQKGCHNFLMVPYI